MNADAISIKTRFETVLKKIAVAFLFLIAGALLARIQLLSIISPFGPAFAAACFLARRQDAPFAAAGVMCGALLTPDPLYIVTVTGIICTAGFLLRDARRWMIVMSAACAYAVAAAVFKTRDVYIFMMATLECLTSLLMIYALQTLIKLFTGGVKRSVFSTEEVICFTLGALMIVCTLAPLSVLGIYAADIAAMFAVLGIAYAGGAALGAGVGLALGTALCIGVSCDVTFIGMLGIAGMVSGSIRRLKRLGVAIGFVLVNLLFIITFFSSAIWHLVFIEAALAAGIFLALPKKAYSFAGRFFDFNTRREAEYALHSKRLKELTAGRLKEVSEVFLQTGEMFSKEAADKIKADADVSDVLSLVAESTCKNCVFRKSCWDNDFLGTYSVFKKLFIAYEKNGKVDRESVDASFAKKCYNLDGVLSCAQNVFRAFVLNVKWNRKIEESRLVTGRQLKGVARVVRELGREMDTGFRFLESVEQEITVLLDAQGLRAREVCAESSGGALSVAVRIRNCGGRGCASGIEGIVSGACGVKMKKSPETGCASGKYCTLKFEQARNLGISAAAACAAKTTVSGDSFSHASLKDGRYMLLLCDGMGSGESARRESDAAISLIENFYQAGFDEEVIFDTINRLLILKGGEEAFSTVDLCMADLRSGEASFTKIGAERSYILRGEEVLTVMPGSPPIGILDDVTPVVTRMDLEAGDIIVMMSDGAADSVKNGKKEWFLSIPRDDALKTAEAILEKAKGEKPPRDDMTVMAALVTKGGEGVIPSG